LAINENERNDCPFHIEMILNKNSSRKFEVSKIRFTFNLSARASCNKEQQVDDFSRWDIILGQQTHNITPHMELAMQMLRSHFTDGYPI
jgi:hypothetical protein